MSRARQHFRQTAHLSEEEQLRALGPTLERCETYLDLQERDPAVLMATLGLRAPSASTQVTPTNFLEQLDEVWRETIDVSDPETKKRKFNEFMNRLEGQVARLPQGKQEAALQPIMKQMAIYASLQQNDPEELKVRLGLSARSASTTADRLGEAAAEPVDLMPQVDEFWREIFGRDKKFIETKHGQFVKRMQDRVSHLPKAEQDALLWQVYMKNEEYAKLAQLDRPALKARLGLQASSTPTPVSTNQLNSSPYTEHLVHVAVDTAVRATVWQGIRAIFRALR